MDEGKELPQDGDTARSNHAADSEQKNLAELWALRNALNKQCERDVAERKRTNSEYTEEEMRLGADHRERTVSQYDQENQIAGEYIEELEPQLREQVLKINRKGYMTQYAGFFGENCDQQIMGDFRLNEETLQRLTVLGISVYTGPNWNLEMERQSGIHREDIPEDAKFTTVIKFHPENADLQLLGLNGNKLLIVCPIEVCHPKIGISVVISHLEPAFLLNFSESGEIFLKLRKIINTNYESC